MEKGKALGLGYLKGVYFCFLMAVVKESNGESVTLPTNNVVYFDQEVKEVFQENIYISCRESEAVMFIPLAQLHQFPAVKDLQSSSKIGSDRCYVSMKRTIAGVNGIEITIPFEECGSGLMWDDDLLIFRFPRELAFVAEGDVAYDALYTCQYRSGEQMFARILENRKSLLNPSWSTIGAWSTKGPRCSSFTNDFVIPAIGDFAIDLVLTSGSSETTKNASAVTFDESWRDTVTMNKTSHTIAMPLSQHDAINNKPRSKGFRILTGNSEYQGVVVVHDNANRQAASFGVLPTCSWGTAYVIVTYPGSRSFVVVTALEQETVVRLSCQHSTTATYNLSSLQTIYFETNDAAALGCSWPASHITANKPISVISVSTNVQIPYSAKKALLTKDIIAEQLLPVSSWGYEYVANLPSSHSAGCLVLLVSHTQPAQVELFHGNHSTTYLVKPYQTVNIDLRSNQTSLLRSVTNSVFLAVLFGKSGVARDIEEQASESVSVTRHSAADYPFMSLLIPTSKFSNAQSASSRPDATTYVGIATKAHTDLLVFGFRTSAQPWSSFTNASSVKVSRQLRLPDSAATTVYTTKHASSVFGASVYSKEKEASLGHAGAMLFVHNHFRSSTTPVSAPATVVSSSAFELEGCDSCIEGSSCKMSNGTFLCICTDGSAGFYCNGSSILLPGNYYLTASDRSLVGLYPVATETPSYEAGGGTTDQASSLQSAKNYDSARTSSVTSVDDLPKEETRARDFRLATRRMQIELVFLGNAYAIRNIRDCPYGPTCLYWLNLLEDSTVKFVKPSSGPHTWHLLPISSSEKAYLIQSSLNGMFLRNLNGSLSPNIDQAAGFVLDLMADQGKAVASNLYESFLLVEIRSKQTGSIHPISLKGMHKSFTKSTAYTFCFWYKSHNGSASAFPAVMIDEKAVIRLHATEVESGKGAFVVELISGKAVTEPSARSERFVLPDQKYWHHFCMRRTTNPFRLDTFLDGFQLPWMFFNVRTLRAEAYGPSYALCWNAIAGNCFSGYIVGTALWFRILANDELHSVFKAAPACGLKHLNPDLYPEPSNEGFLQSTYHVASEVLYPVCACKYCPRSWVVSGSSCFRVDGEQQYSFRDYFQGRVCQPVSGWRIAHMHAIPSMVDAVLAKSVPGAYYGLYRKKRSRTYLYYDGRKILVKSRRSVDLCGVVQATKTQVNYTNKWPSSNPGALSSPRRVEMGVQLCTTRRHVLCQQEAWDFSPAQDIQVILVATSGDNMRGKASDALVHMINMVQSDNARFIIYVSERDSLNFRRGLPNNTQIVPVGNSPLAEEELPHFLHFARSNLTLSTRTFIVIASFRTIFRSIPSIHKELKGWVEYARVLSFYALGSENVSQHYLESLATQSDFTFRLTSGNFTDGVEKSFGRLLCGKTGLPPVATNLTHGLLAPDVEPRAQRFAKPFNRPAVVPFATKPESEGGIALDCTNLGMSVQVPTDLVLEFVPVGSTKSFVVHLGKNDSDEKCRSNASVLNPTGHPVFSLFVPVPFKSCNITVLNDRHETRAVALLFVTSSVGTTAVTYKQPLAKLSCKYGPAFGILRKAKTVSSSFLPYAGKSPLLNLEQLAKVKIDLHLFRDLQMVQPWSTAAPLVSVGERIFVLANVSRAIPPPVELLVETCVASRTPVLRSDNHDDLRLIDNNCVVDSGISTTLHNRSPSSLLFSFPVFRWSQGGTKQVFLHCRARLCNNSDGQCETLCSESSTVKRRSVAGDRDSSRNVLSATIRVTSDLKISKSSGRVANKTKEHNPKKDARNRISDLQSQSYATRYPYHLLGLVLLTFLFMTSVIVAISLLSRKQTSGDLARYASSHYIRAPSISDPDNSCSLTTAQTVSESNNNPRPCDLVEQSTASALNVAAAIIPESNAKGRFVSLEKRRCLQPMTLSPPETPEGRGMLKRSRPFTTFLGSSSKTKDATPKESESKPSTFKSSAAGTCRVFKPAQERRSKVAFEGISVDETAM